MKFRSIIVSTKRMTKIPDGWEVLETREITRKDGEIGYHILLRNPPERGGKSLRVIGFSTDE